MLAHALADDVEQIVINDNIIGGVSLADIETRCLRRSDVMIARGNSRIVETKQHEGQQRRNGRRIEFFDGNRQATRIAFAFYNTISLNINRQCRRRRWRRGRRWWWRRRLVNVERS